MSKPDLTPAQKRALADLNCAAKKLIPLLRERGEHNAADSVSIGVQHAKNAMGRINRGES